MFLLPCFICFLFLVLFILVAVAVVCAAQTYIHTHTPHTRFLLPCLKRGRKGATTTFCVWVGRPRLTLLLMRGACCLQTGMFKHVDACYSLAFATMMLQTALHNPQAGRSMNLESFTRLNLNMNCRTSDMGDIHPTWDPEDRWVGGVGGLFLDHGS